MAPGPNTSRPHPEHPVFVLQLPGVQERIFVRSGKWLEEYVKLVPVEPNTWVHL